MSLNSVSLCLKEAFTDLFSGVSAPANSAAAPSFSAAAYTAPAAVDGKASDDLLQLAGNPFANMLNGKSRLNGHSLKIVFRLNILSMSSVPQKIRFMAHIVSERKIFYIIPSSS